MQALKCIFESYAKSRTRSALYKLNDHILLDIGIHRDEISNHVDKMFEGVKC